MCSVSCISPPSSLHAAACLPPPLRHGGIRLVSAGEYECLAKCPSRRPCPFFNSVSYKVCGYVLIALGYPGIKAHETPLPLFCFFSFRDQASSSPSRKDVVRRLLSRRITHCPLDTGQQAQNHPVGRSIYSEKNTCRGEIYLPHFRWSIWFRGPLL